MKSPQRSAAFACEKRPAAGSRAMVVTNHPLASAAGAEILLGGGNAIDAAIASLFALTVVEPMMVGVLGGGIAHIRLAGGRHVVIDALSTAPAAAHDAMYETVSDELPDYRKTVGRANEVGPLAVAVPGALAGWCRALDHFGTLSVADVAAPAIRLAERGFTATPYLADCVADLASDLARDAGLAALFLPGGVPIRAGSRIVQPEYARTLRIIARDGPGALYGGPLGDELADTMARTGGLVGREDVAAYRVIHREPIRGTYRGFEVLGPPPPASSGVHVVQMLNVLEGFDVRGMGFGSADALHLLAESMKIAFADRAVATADPAFVDVPVERLTDKGYAGQRRLLIDPARTRRWTPGVFDAEAEPAPADPAGRGASPSSEAVLAPSGPAPVARAGRTAPPVPGPPDATSGESSCTTHVTVADAEGNVVATTQTVNGLFGACVQVPGTGMIANNYMFNFDPHPGRALSVEPGKRVFTSMAPMMVRRGKRLLHALGLPGGLRIFPSALQALVNLLDHGMSLQQAVEAPRIWTEGGVVEMEEAFPEDVAGELLRRGHEIARLRRIGGGMNAISFDDVGTLTGAACWRADGTPVGIAGGLARPGVRFSST